MNIYLEIFGYLGTILVILSMMMTSLKKLRVFNISGAIISTIYSIIYNAWPIVIMNLCLIIINMYHLIIDNRSYYKIIKVNNNDQSLIFFINKNIDNINKIYPDFNSNNFYNNEIYLIYYNNKNIGIIIGEKNNNIFNIKLFYFNNNLKIENYISIFELLKNDNINTINYNLINIYK